MRYVLGLDLGPTSVGWAMIRETNGKPTNLVDLGVRIFQEGVDRAPTGAEASKNTQRRMKRAMRRGHDRTRRRKTLLRNTLVRAGLLPPDGAESERLMAENPYALRARGLDEPLSRHEFGRAIYHLAQRRGYRSNRKTDQDEDKGVVGPAVVQLDHDIAAAGCRTVGEYFAGLDPRETRIRGHYTGRTMFTSEFEALWNTQAAHHPEILTDALKQQLFRAIFDQRPLKVQRHLVGRCTFEPDKKRAAKGGWYFQQFRLLQTVNQLSLTDTRGVEHDLSQEQRDALVSKLALIKKLTFDGARKALDLPEGTRFNLEIAGRKDLPGNNTAASLKSAIGAKALAALSEAQRDRLVHDLLFVEDEGVLDRHLTEYGFSGEANAKLKKARLERGYGHLSQRAIRHILPHLETGLVYDKAVEEAGYRFGVTDDGERVSALPTPPDTRNPIVNRALTETRKVVNALAREYGPPSRIRIEMARDLKNGAKARDDIRKRQRINEKLNKNARERLIEAGIAEPTRGDIIRYRLWEECNHQCPYTGRSIPWEGLFSGEWDIEHILPRHRSLDDSFANKTLCYADENRRVKCDKTPWEAYGDDPEQFGQILARVRRFQGIGWKKVRKFTQKELKLDDFVNRQLADTRYISKAVKDYVAPLVGSSMVEVGRGQMTAELRRLWGLNTLLGDTGEKVRADHRHHAIDAVVTALASRGALMAASRLHQGYRPQRGADRHFNPPWDRFRDDVGAKLEEVVISHRVQRRARGALHEETNHGVLNRHDEKGTPLFAKRRPVADLTAKEIERVADDRIRRIIQDHLERLGVDPKDDAARKKALTQQLYLPNANGDPVPINKVRLHVPSSGMIRLGGKGREPYRAVEPGGNHHIVIYEYTDKKGRTRRDGEVVSLYEASQRIRRGEPVIRRNLGEGCNFICSLSVNETVEVPAPDRGADYYRVQKMTEGVITFRRHTASTLDNNEERLFASPNTLKGRKVVVDPIGRVSPSGD